MAKKSLNVFVNKITEAINDEDSRSFFQFLLSFIVFGLTGLVMTIVNIVTDKGVLTLVTAAFSLLSVINIVLLLFRNKITSIISRSLFAIETVSMFIYFIISGTPEGFSALWVTLLPLFALLLFKVKYGSFFSLMMFFVLVFLFWTPFGRGLLQYNYNETFLMRFPILYIVAYFVSLVFELVRDFTYRAHLKTKEEYHYLSVHDPLTGLYNRAGFNEFMLNRIDNNAALAIFDFDYFKKINDTYGHMNGDIVLKAATKKIKETLGDKGEISRWGGEEFIMVVFDKNEAVNISTAILKTMRNYRITFEGGSAFITLSIGLVLLDDNIEMDLHSLLKQADANLYTAKQKGRNRLITSNYQVTKIEDEEEEK